MTKKWGGPVSLAFRKIASFLHKGRRQNGSLLKKEFKMGCYAPLNLIMHMKLKRLPVCAEARCLKQVKTFCICVDLVKTLNVLKCDT